MVAINWETIPFNVPRSLASYEFTAPMQSSGTGALVVSGEPRGQQLPSVNGHRTEPILRLAQKACSEIYQFVSHPLRVKLDELSRAKSQHEQIERYNAAVLTAARLQAEWNELLKQCWLYDEFSTLREAWQTNRKNAKELQRQWLNGGLKHSVFQPKGFRSVVTAQFVSLYGKNMLSRLLDHGEETAIDLAKQCTQQLLDLVELASVGLAQWYPSNTCCYAFFRRHYGAKSVRSYPIEGTIACHKHDLIDAYGCHPANAPVEIPSGVQQLIDSAPTWVKEHLKLIVGTIVQEQVSEKTVNQEYWDLVRVVPYIHCDPALVIGPFVLAGWGPSDTNDEQGIIANVSTDVPLRIASQLPLRLVDQQSLRETPTASRAMLLCKKFLGV